jgi:hypothetical protein
MGSFPNKAQLPEASPMRTEQTYRSADLQRLHRDQLHHQQSTWFAWVCRLHEMHSRLQTPESAAVLAIARRRWADARRALERVDEPTESPASESTMARPVRNDDRTGRNHG